MTLAKSPSSNGQASSSGDLPPQATALGKVLRDKARLGPSLLGKDKRACAHLHLPKLSPSATASTLSRDTERRSNLKASTPRTCAPLAPAPQHCSSGHSFQGPPQNLPPQSNLLHTALNPRSQHRAKGAPHGLQDGVQTSARQSATLAPKRRQASALS